MNDTERSANPAERLHAFLSQFQAHDGGSVSAKEVLADMFSVHQSQTWLLQQEIWRASQLPNKCMEALVNTVGLERAMNICRWDSATTNFFSALCLNASMAQLTPYLDKNSMHSLYTCAVLLEKTDTRVDATRELLNTIRGLRTEVREMNLSPDVKDFVLSSLRDLEAVLGDYCHDVADSAEVISVWWRTVDKLKTLRGAGLEMDDARAILERLLSVVQEFEALLVDSQEVIELMQSATKLLGA